VNTTTGATCNWSDGLIAVTWPWFQSDDLFVR